MAKHQKAAYLGYLSYDAEPNFQSFETGHVWRSEPHGILFLSGSLFPILIQAYSNPHTTEENNIQRLK